MSKPKVFIGCAGKSRDGSRNGLDVAASLQSLLQDDAELLLWNEGLFGLSKSTLDSLLSILGSMDFGIFVFTKDDPVERARGRQFAPRDNVVFELGVFMGRLGPERAIVVTDPEPDLEILTDLSGITIATYHHPAGALDGLASAVGPAATTIRAQLRKHGAFPRRERELGALYRILNACTSPHYPDVDVEFLSHVSHRTPESFRDVSDVLDFLRDLLVDYVHPMLHPPERDAMRIYFAYPLMDGVRLGDGQEVSCCSDVNKDRRPISGDFVIGLSNPRGFEVEQWREGRVIDGYDALGAELSNCAAVFKRGVAHYKPHLDDSDGITNYDTEDEQSVFSVPIEWRSHQGNARIGVIAASSRHPNAIDSRVQVRLQLLCHIIGYIFSLFAIENTDSLDRDEFTLRDKPVVGIDSGRVAAAESFTRRVVALRRRVASHFESKFLHRGTHALTGDGLKYVGRGNPR